MNISRQKVFVTGGSGFVGRELLAALKAKGCQIVALARSESATAEVIKSGASPVKGDLSDVSILQEGMGGCSAVFHAAAMVSDWGQRKEFEEVTVRGTKHVLAAAKAAGVSRFVHIGTEAVLAGGKPILNADENAPYPAHPVGLYPWSKALAERAVIAANAPGFATMSIRPRLVWGRGDTSLLPKLNEVMSKGQWIWFGGGHHLTSTCHVRNLAEGALLAAERGTGGQIYHLTDGRPVDFRDFLTEMSVTQGVTPPDRTAPMWFARAIAMAGEAVWSVLHLRGRPPITRMAVNLFFSEVTINDRKAREELGYHSHVSVQQGLAELRPARVPSGAR